MANKTIKGLTVEIGGDTTKLGKALEDVEKKSRDLSSELGQINKLLKMDPGNADLLAQKQKVLADAVENTRKKLDTLKDAERQVQAQFERGEASEEQVRALQREIIATTKKLSGYEKAAGETAFAINHLGDASDKAKDDTKKAKKGAEDAADGFEEMADAADKAGDAGDGLGSKLGGLAKGGLAAVAGALVAAGGALVGAAESTREYRTEMGKLDTAFTTAGHSSEAAASTYKTLQGVLGETEQAVEASNHLAKLTDNEQDLQKWTDICTGVYATFGASLPIEGLTEAANETAKTGALTGGLADALNWAGVNEEQFQAQLDACSTEQERQALITETLNGLYSEAAEKYKETNAELIRANEANEAWTASMAEAGAAVEPILTDVKMLGASLLSDLMPGITGVAEAFRGVLNGDEGAAEALGASLSGIFTNLLTKLTEMLPALATTAMSLVTTLTTTIIEALPQLVATGYQVTISILNGLTQAIPQVINALVAMIPQLVQVLVEAVPQLIQGAVNLFLALVQAIPLILPPLIEALPQIVMAIINGLMLALPQLLQGALQFLTAIVQAIPLLIEMLVPLIPQIVVTIIDGLISCIPVLLEGAIQLLNAIVQAIPLIIEALVPQVPGIVETITTKLAEMHPMLLSAAVRLLWAIIKAIPQIVAALVRNLPQILRATTSVLSAMPSLIWKILKEAINKVAEFGSQAKTKAADAAKKLLNAVTSGVKSLPSKLKKVGTDLVKGLWNGINDMTSWVKDKIEGFGSDVLDGIKDFFGIHSPSREMAWVGEMLDRGLAQGVLDNMGKPLDAMTEMAEGMLDEAEGMNGLTLERQLNHTFTADAASAAETGLLGKLDSILAAIERGQILTIDSKKLIGATANGFDSELGQRRALVARGAM